MTFYWTSILLFCLPIIYMQSLFVENSADYKTYFNIKQPDIRCHDIVLDKSVEYRGQFLVLRNYIRAKKQFKCLESVTLSVPGDYRFLDNIFELAERWKGPISVALYSPGYDFFTTLQSIAYLRNCHEFSPLVKEYVTFHLFFDVDHMPQMNDQPLFNIYQDQFDCIQKPSFVSVKDNEMYKHRNALFYPINVARNIAKLNAQTHFVFPSDIELYPIRNFISMFFQFVQDNPQYFRENSRNVFVLPLFEINARHRIPENKTELVNMLKNDTAFWFHQKVCSSCHKVPQSKRWIEDNHTQTLGIFISAKREGRQKIWEPFFICTQKEPLWDERLNWEGQGNKMCQAQQLVLNLCEYFDLKKRNGGPLEPLSSVQEAFHLCLLDYKFLVFDNSFLIHKPGVKKKKIQNIKFKHERKKNNAILRNISSELKKIYGNKTNCKIHDVLL